MRILAQCFILVFLAGCWTPIQRHQKGGGSEMEIPATVPRIVVTQPENPEGSSGSSFIEKVETTSPDGTKVVTERKISTNISGSQDLAKIMKEYMGSQYFKNILSAVALCLIGFYFRKDWPTVAVVLFGGAAVSLIFGWQMSLFSLIAAVIVPFVYYKMKALP
jgi:Ca2+-dependent lipid-binding protein